MIGTNRNAFNWDTLTTSAVIDLGATHVNGTTTIIQGKKFTNLVSGTLFGSCVAGVWSSGTPGTGTIIIRGCYFGPSIGEAIQFEWFGASLSDKIIIENCFFANNKNGVYSLNGTAQYIIRNNQFLNPHGARGGRGQAIQLNSVTASGSIIYNNRIECFRGEGYSEDLISMFNVTGASGNVILISKNLARGGGPSASGGGFITGDSGGSWQTMEYNKLLNPGNYILACSGGTNIAIQNNMGYQESFPWTNIAMYAYKVSAAACSDINVTGNSMFITPTNYWYAPGGAESCGTISGTSFTPNNSTGLSLATLDFPTTLIDLVTVDNLWLIRKDSVQFRVETIEGGFPASLPRPTANSEADKGIAISTTTINSTGSTGGTIYNWVLVKGPNNTSNGLTMTNTTTATLSISGMITGVYRFRLEYSDTDGASDADWTTVTVTL